MDLLSGILGVVLGVFLNEFIRRINRVEQFNNQIFNRRLEEYIQLHDLLMNQYSTVMDMLDNFEGFDKDQKLEFVSDIIYPIVNFNDMRSFFLSEELIVQTSTLFMGIEACENDEVEEIRTKISLDYQKTMQMIKNESGIEKVNHKFKKLLKYNHKSPIIKYYNQNKKKYLKGVKKNKM